MANGLFSRNAQVMGPQQAMADVGRGLARMAEPALGMMGMQSEEQAVLSIMEGVDPTNLNSVKQGFRDILQISPPAAIEFRKQMMPFIKSQQEQQKLAAQMMPKPKERKIIKDAQGRQRYVDTGELVFPGVTPPKKDKTVNIKSPTKQDADMILSEIDAHYQTGFFDMLDASLPEGMTQESLVDFIFRYKQINPEETTITVVDKLIEGKIDPKQTISTVAPTSTNNNNRKVPRVIPPPVSK